MFDLNWKISFYCVSLKISKCIVQGELKVAFDVPESFYFPNCAAFRSSEVETRAF